MNSKPKILIVDDVSSNIHLLMSILKDKYIIVAATNGEKALELAQKEPKPDLILLDIVMPEMDGYEVCEKIKGNIQTRDIPVVFVTSLNSIDEQERGLSVGGVDFISKPFSKDMVLHKVETYIKFQSLKNSIDNDTEKNEEKLMNHIKYNILIVDDSPENIQVMVEVLKDEYVVNVATSGNKALEILENGFIPDLILLDVIMPEMDGYELCEILKNKKEYANIPIIFVTILENEKDIVRGFELGAVDYAIKPIEPTVIKARINTHLKLKSFQDSLLEDIKIKNELIYNQSKMAILGEMFENITHQWKQPLSAISVTTSGIRLKKEYGDLDAIDWDESLDTIDASVKYLSQTIDDFRNFISNDKLKSKFNVKEIIEKTITLLSSKFKNNDINIINNFDDIYIESYQNDLIQILMNIFSNALDALLKKENNRTIWVDYMNSENKLTIYIKDNAGGIVLDELEKIFDKYYTSKKEKEGNGIGLYMCRKIVHERLNGQVNAYNKDDGACFEIIIPL